MAEDLDAVAALWGDEAVVRHISGVPSTRDEAWGRLLRYRGTWAVRGYGFWLVEETATGRFVGEVGFLDALRGLDPAPEGIEAGWVLSPAFWGVGAAKETVAAALAWSDEAYGAPHWCLIAPENTGSIRVAAASGFGDQREVAFKDRTALLLRR